MDSKLITHIQSLSAQKRDFPEVKTGMQVEVSQKIIEGDKTRIQKFAGVVIKTSGKAGEKTFTVRRVASGFGIEKSFPLNCPTLVDVVIIRQYKVNRKNIRYVRELSGKSARLKEVKLPAVSTKKSPVDTDSPSV